jgi:hypothetical protein
VLLDCANCAAPLDVKPNAWVATCAYCGRTQQVRAKPKAPTPPGWQAPTQWTPPATAHVHQVFLYNPGSAARKQSRFVTCLVLLPILLTVGATTLPFLIPLMSAKMASWTWDGAETLECGGNDRRTLSDVDVKAKATPAIVVRGNCELTIESSRIRGTEVLDVRENGRVTIRDSELSMRGNVGLRVDGNFGAKIIKSKIRVKGEGDEVLVLDAGGNAGITLEGSELSVEVSQKALLTLAQSNGNGRIELRNTAVTIKGGRRIVIAPDGFGLASVQYRGGSIDAGGRDLVAQGPHDVNGVDLRGSKIVSGEEASAASSVPAELDATCKKALDCCVRVLGVTRCENVKSMPPAGCAVALDGYKQAGRSTGIRCE